jgi:hypothetical protein
VSWRNGLDLFYSPVNLKIDWGQRLRLVTVSLRKRGSPRGTPLFDLGMVALPAACLGLDAGVLYPFVRLGDMGVLDAPLFSLTGVTSVVFSLFLVADVTRVYQAETGTNAAWPTTERTPPDHFVAPNSRPNGTEGARTPTR